MRFTNNQIISALITAALIVLLWLPEHWVVKTNGPFNILAGSLNMWQTSEIFRWVWIVLVVLVVLNILYDIIPRVLGVGILFFSMIINYFILKPEAVKATDDIVNAFNGALSVTVGVFGWISLALIIVVAVVVQSLDDAEKISKQQYRQQDQQIMEKEGHQMKKSYSYQEPNFEDL